MKAVGIAYSSLKTVRLSIEKEMFYDDEECLPNAFYKDLFHCVFIYNGIAVLVTTPRYYT